MFFFKQAVGPPCHHFIFLITFLTTYYIYNIQSYKCNEKNSHQTLLLTIGSTSVGFVQDWEVLWNMRLSVLKLGKSWANKDKFITLADFLMHLISYALTPTFIAATDRGFQ